MIVRLAPALFLAALAFAPLPGLAQTDKTPAHSTGSVASALQRLAQYSANNRTQCEGNCRQSRAECQHHCGLDSACGQRCTATEQSCISGCARLPN